MNDKAIRVVREEGFYKGYTENLPFVGEDAIYVPCQPLTPNGIVSNYTALLTKELFIEAYNKWIKETTNE